MKYSPFSICMRLIVLVKPLTKKMITAILLGLTGHLAASMISILGSSVLLKLTPFSVHFTLFLMILCALARGPLRYIEQACNHDIAFRLLAILRDKVFGKLRQLAPAKLEGKDKGNLISMITSDIELLEVFYAHTISPIAIAFLQVIIMCTLFTMIHPVLALCALLVYVLNGIVLPIVISKRNQDAGIQMRNASGDLSSFVLETLRGMDDLMQYHQNEQIKRKLQEKSTRLNLYEKRQKDLLAQNNAFSQGIMLSGNAILFVLAMILAQNQMISYREAVLAFVMLSSSYGPTAALAALGSTLQNTFAAGHRILNLLDEPCVTETVVSDIKPVFEGANISHVSFSYQDEKVLDDISINIPKGKILGISGKSGSGKSTLLRLLMRFWETNQGEIQISFHSINTIDSHALTDMESFMIQDTWMFHDTIEENLRIAKPDASFEELEEACKKASIHDFILSLPQGYQTKAAELGNSLSAGEKQRIGLARIFLKQSDLILLDEPTSNLDSLNEAMILKAIRKYQEEKTIVLVSHRPQTLKIADTIFQIKQGRAS